MLHKTRVIFLLIVLCLFSASLSADLNTGLVAYFPFTGNPKDDSGKGNNGFLNGPTLTQDHLGRANSAYAFDGFNDYINIGSNPCLKMTEAISISAWVKPLTYSPQYQNIVSDHDPNEFVVGCGKLLRFEWATLQFHVGGVHGAGTSIYVKKDFDTGALGQWVHVVGTYDRNTVRLYVNAAEVDTRAYSEPLTVNPNPILIGRSGYEEFFQGNIDDVRIYDRALTQDEISMIYTEPFILDQQPSTLFAWHGDEIAVSLNYQNHTSTEATHVVIQTRLPSGLELVDGSISSGGSYDPLTREIDWMIASLPASIAAQAVGFRVAVGSSIPEGLKIDLTAQIASDEVSIPTTSRSTITFGPPRITNISPAQGGDSGSVTIAIAGVYLGSHAGAKLTKAGASDIVASEVKSEFDGTSLRATFDLTSRNPGSYALTVANPGGSLVFLPNCFTVISGGEPKFWTDIIGPGTIRVGRPTMYQCLYGNSGNVNSALGWVELQLPETYECINITDDQNNVIWNQATDANSPMFFYIAPIAPGETRRINVSLMTTSLSPDPLSTTITVEPFTMMTFLGAIIWDTVEEFALSFFKHKWDEYGPPGQDNIYNLDWAAAFKNAAKDFFSLEHMTIFTGEIFWTANRDLMIKWLDKQGRHLAAYNLNIFFIILEAKAWVDVFRENIQNDPNFHNASESRKEINKIFAIDPNDKAGPAGFDPSGIAANLKKKFVSPYQSFSYSVFFENLETATAAVQDMKITDQLDPSLDWSTFAFDTFQIGSQLIAIPWGKQYFSTTIDMRPDIKAIVEVECAFNAATGSAEWIFRGKDPITGVLTDFLPPNSTADDPKGRGWVTYQIKPKSNLSTGTVIKNKATIDFEIDVPPDPIDTPEWINTIDNAKPESHVIPLGPVQKSLSFPVIWDGTDADSGIGSFTIYVSDNGNPYSVWLSNTKVKTATFTGLDTHTYSFLSVATDNVGNEELVPATADTITTVLVNRILINRKALVFGSNAGSLTTQTQKIFISRTGSGSLGWTATSDRTWLSVTPGSGSGTGISLVSVSPTGLSAGSYSGTISVSDPLASNSPQTVNVSLNVYAQGQSVAPFGYFDTPSDGTTGITGSLPVTGWVLDDIEVTEVQVRRDAHPLDPPAAIGPDGRVFIGWATFVDGARPDVETAYQGYPLNSRAGWGYMMLTNFLPNKGNGTYKVYAVAKDKEGNVITLGSKTFTCDNANATKPFGTIDTPSQGGDTSGSAFVNFGWALTPQAGTIPKDGSTIRVWVDGAPVGTLNTPPNVYNQYRSDVSTLFPGLNNTSGPVGAFYLDTTKYANGVHSIAWGVTDDLARVDGIGSRYFNVVNLGAASGEAEAAFLQSAAAVLWDALPFPAGPIRIKRGYCGDTASEVLMPDETGVFRVELSQKDRIEILFGEEREMAAFAAKGTRTWGFLTVGEELRQLPIGSTLDSRSNRFSWMPGPAFLGKYDLVFLTNDESGVSRRISVRVNIKSPY